MAVNSLTILLIALFGYAIEAMLLVHLASSHQLAVFGDINAEIFAANHRLYIFGYLYRAEASGVGAVAKLIILVISHAHKEPSLQTAIVWQKPADTCRTLSIIFTGLRRWV